MATLRARSIVRLAGGAELIPESTLTHTELSERLRTLLGDRTRLLAMADKAREQAQINAAETVAQACIEVAA